LGWGSPWFDIADFWNVCHVMNEESTIDLIHLDRKQLLQCWEVFCDEYFGFTTAAQRDSLVEKLLPYELSVPLMVERLCGTYPGLAEDTTARIARLRNLME